jgi:DNA-binding transcriptional LysR family regulator
MKRHQCPRDPGDLAALDGIVMRSDSTGRVRPWTMRNVEGDQMPAPLSEKLVVNDATASCRCAVLGLGVALLAVPDVLHPLESHALVRLLPEWYADAGDISLYCMHRKLMPAKTRAFVDHVVEASRQARWAQRFAAHGAGVDAGNLRVIQAAL